MTFTMEKYFLLAGFVMLAGSNVVVNASADYQSHLELICSGQWWQIKRSSEIGEFFEILDKLSDERCSQLIKNSIVDLKKILLENNKDICNGDKVKEIGDYYYKYIDSRKASPDNKKLPKAIEFFFLAFSFQVSSACKKSMINTLLWDTTELLKQEDLEHISAWTDENSVIANVINEPGDYDDLILPKDFVRIINGHSDESDRDNEQKLIIETETLDAIERIRASCAQKFRPIYRKVILPLVDLSNLGFNYQGEDLEREQQEMKTNKIIHQWYRIVYFCESLLELEFAETRKDKESSKGMPNKTVLTVLSPADAELLRKENKLIRSKSLDQLEKDALVYKTELAVQLPDEIIDLSDEKLLKLIKNFNTHRDELDAIRLRLLRKIGRYIKERLKQGEIFVAMKTLLFGGQSGHGDAGKDKVSQTSMNQDLIDQMDLIISKSQGDDRSRPLAGLGSSFGKAKKIGTNVARYGKRNYQQLSYVGTKGMFNAAENAIKPSFWTQTVWYIIASAIFIIAIIAIMHGG